MKLSDSYKKHKLVILINASTGEHKPGVEGAWFYQSQLCTNHTEKKLCSGLTVRRCPEKAKVISLIPVRVRAWAADLVPWSVC